MGFWDAHAEEKQVRAFGSHFTLSWVTQVPQLMEDIN